MSSARLPMRIKKTLRETPSHPPKKLYNQNEDYIATLFEFYISVAKVNWIISLFLISFKVSIVHGNETTTLSSLKIETTTETSRESEVENDKSKSQGDLDLETQDQVAILKQINRVNDDGSYTFGYEAADGSFKIETRDVNGNVKGMFGFINEDGELKRVSYSASNGTGFQSTGTLNIPPLPGTTLSVDEEKLQTFKNSKFDPTISLKPKLKDNTSTKINLLEPTTAAYINPLEKPSSKLPIYIYGSTTPESEITSSSRPVVIQHIPKVRPTPGSIATLPTGSEEILLKPLLSDLAPKRTSNSHFISFGTNDASSVSESTTTTTSTEDSPNNPSVIQVIRPRPGPLKKVTLTKRPLVTTTPKVITTTEYKSKEYLEKLKNKGSKTEAGSGFRRQLGITNNYATSTTPNLVTSGTEDRPDVYGGKHISRPYPTSIYRALFNQIPQHQRILQNSYVQNRNQYFPAVLGNPGIPVTTPPQIPPSSNPDQVRTYTGGTNPQDPNLTVVQPGYVSTPSPHPASDLQNQRPVHIVPGYEQQFSLPGSTIAPAYPADRLPNQIYISPILLEHLIRMLLLTQQRLVSQRQQPVNHFQQGVVATLGPTNVPLELPGNRYDNRYYQPSVAYPYSEPMPSRPPFDTQYSAPNYQGYAHFDPRYGIPAQMFTPIPYTHYPPRVIPFNIDPVRQQQVDDFILRMLLGYTRLQPQASVVPIQPIPNVVERSPTYQTQTKDSSTSSTTPSPKVGPVRNVEILGQIGEESQTSVSYESSTKAGK